MCAADSVSGRICDIAQAQPLEPEAQRQRGASAYEHRQIMLECDSGEHGR